MRREAPMSEGEEAELAAFLRAAIGGDEKAYAAFLARVAARVRIFARRRKRMAAAWCWCPPITETGRRSGPWPLCMGRRSASSTAPSTTGRWTITASVL